MYKKLYISLLVLCGSIQFSMEQNRVLKNGDSELSQESILRLLDDVVSSGGQVKIAGPQLQDLCDKGIVVHEMPGRPCVKFKEPDGKAFWSDYALARENIMRKDGMYREAKVCTESAPLMSAQETAYSNWCE